MLAKPLPRFDGAAVVLYPPAREPCRQKRPAGARPRQRRGRRPSGARSLRAGGFQKQPRGRAPEVRPGEAGVRRGVPPAGPRARAERAGAGRLQCAQHLAHYHTGAKCAGAHQRANDCGQRRTAGGKAGAKRHRVSGLALRPGGRCAKARDQSQQMRCARPPATGRGHGAGAWTGRGPRPRRGQAAGPGATGARIPMIYMARPSPPITCAAAAYPHGGQARSAGAPGPRAKRAGAASYPNRSVSASGAGWAPGCGAAASGGERLGRNSEQSEPGGRPAGQTLPPVMPIGTRL